MQSSMCWCGEKGRCCADLLKTLVKCKNLVRLILSALSLNRFTGKQPNRKSQENLQTFVFVHGNSWRRIGCPDSNIVLAHIQAYQSWAGSGLTLCKLSVFFYTFIISLSQRRLCEGTVFSLTAVDMLKRMCTIPSSPQRKHNTNEEAQSVSTNTF